MTLRFQALSEVRKEIMTSLGALAGVLAVGTVVYHLLEGWSWLNSFYFAVCTLTTVGYGDLVPTSDASRLFTALYVLAGVSIALATLSLLGSRYLRRGEQLLFRAGGPK